YARGWGYHDTGDLPESLYRDYPRGSMETMGADDLTYVGTCVSPQTGSFMADITAQPNRNQSRSTLEIVVDRIWRFFCSVRAAIWEIAFLTLLVLIGTLRG